MNNKIKPVFLISLPRSGSTLVQKMLSVSPQVSTLAEPWILLPFAYWMETDGVAAEYDHRLCREAIKDLVNELPGGADNYYQLVQKFTLSIYEQTTNNAESIFFLDKTPRYYLIVDFIHRVFPEARFIFLFRNPLDVLNSVFITWHANKFTPGLLQHYVDLKKGPDAIVSGYQCVKAKAILIEYNDLVSNAEATMQKVCDYIGIDYLPDMTKEYKRIQFSGAMGDQTGEKKYNNISKESIDGWKSFISNKFRKKFIKNYVRTLNDDVLKIFKLDRTTLNHEIDSIPVGFSGCFKDIFGALFFLLILCLRWLAIPGVISKLCSKLVVIPYR